MIRTARSSALVALALTLTVGLIATLSPIVPPAHAQIVTDFQSFKPIPVTRTADDTDIMLLVKHVGTSASGTVTVAADGNITLKVGAASSEAADATVKCPSGGSSGVIDVSDSTCNTLGEVINIINGSANWVAVPLDGLLSDDMDCSGTGCLLALSETSASLLGGKGLAVDTDVALTSTIALLPSEQRKIEFYLAGPAGPSVPLKVSPFKGYRTWVASQLATSTFVSGTSSMTISEVAPNYVRAGSTETVTSLYGPIAGGATTVSKTFIALSDPVKVQADTDQKIILRLTNSAALATVTHTVLGYRGVSPSTR